MANQLLNVNDQETQDDLMNMGATQDSQNNDQETQDDIGADGEIQDDYQTVGIKDLSADMIQSATGTVSAVSDNGFVLTDSTGQIQVDTPGKLNLADGEQVTVIGEYSNLGGQNVFDGLDITKADGTVALNPFGTTDTGGQNDILDGNAQANMLEGDSGNDYITGRGGNDNLVGNDGTDILLGGAGQDILTGGSGADQFSYQSLADGGDSISDFNATEDVINVGEIFGSTNYSSQNPFAEYVQLTQVGSSTQVGIDPDGSAGTNPFEVLTTLENTTASSLSQDNFNFNPLG